MKPLYISSSGPAPPRPLPPLLQPPPSSSLFKISFGLLSPGPTPPLASAGGRGVSAPAAVPVRTHISFSLPLSLPTAPPPRLHLRTHLELLTFYLHYIHHSVPSSHLSWIGGRGRGGVVLSLGRWWGNRVEVGRKIALPPHHCPLGPSLRLPGKCCRWNPRVDDGRDWNPSLLLQGLATAQHQRPCLRLHRLGKVMLPISPTPSMGLLHRRL